MYRVECQDPSSPHGTVLGTPPVRSQACLSLNGCREGIHEASVSPRRIWAVPCYTKILDGDEAGMRGVSPALPAELLFIRHGTPTVPSHRRATKWLPVTQPFSVPP